MKTLSNFIEKSKEDIKNRKDYCILVYSTLSTLNKDLKLVYKNINDFENKIEKDIKSINVIFGVEFQVRFFD